MDPPDAGVGGRSARHPSPSSGVGGRGLYTLSDRCADPSSGTMFPQAGGYTCTAARLANGGFRSAGPTGSRTARSDNLDCMSEFVALLLPVLRVPVTLVAVASLLGSSACSGWRRVSSRFRRSRRAQFVAFLALVGGVFPASRSYVPALDCRRDAPPRRRSLALSWRAV